MVPFQGVLGAPSSSSAADLNFEEEIAWIFLPLDQKSTDAEDIAKE
jgi:hypothetical protein